MSKSAREQVATDLLAIAAIGIASASVNVAVMRLLRSRGLLSDSDLAAICESAKKSAQRSGQSNPQLAALIAEEIDQLWSTVAPQH